MGVSRCCPKFCCNMYRLVTTHETHRKNASVTVNVELQILYAHTGTCDRSQQKPINNFEKSSRGRSQELHKISGHPYFNLYCTPTRVGLRCARPVTFYPVDSMHDAKWMHFLVFFGGRKFSTPSSPHLLYNIINMHPWLPLLNKFPELHTTPPLQLSSAGKYSVSGSDRFLELLFPEVDHLHITSQAQPKS